MIYLTSVTKILDMNHQTASLKGRNPEQSFMMNELEPLALQSLHELVSLVHDCVKPEGDTSADPSVIREENEGKKIICRNLFDLKEDPIAYIIWTLEPHTFQSVFLTMAVSKRFHSNFSFSKTNRKKYVLCLV